MNVSRKQAIALAVCLSLFASHSAQAQLFTRNASGQRPTVAQRPAKAAKKQVAVKKDSAVERAIAAMETSKGRDSETALVDYNTFESSEFSGAPYCESGACEMCFDDCSCSSGCKGGGMGFFDRPGQFFISADYIYARPTFSEALAYVVLDSQQPLEGLRVIEYDFDYKSSYRFSGGYRFCDCGGAIAFNYARYRGDASFGVQDTSASTGTTIFGPYEINAPADGGFLFGDSEVDLDSYDLGVTQNIPLGGCCSPCCDTSCDTCCDPCCGGSCCGCCPAWDITWSAGVRFAEANWSKALTSFESNLDPVEASLVRLEFEGVGARVGLGGRRYFGQKRWFSMYAKGDLSILVGDMFIQATETDLFTPGPTTIVHTNSARRTIPVTEIEAGLTAHVGRFGSLTGGYFLSAWHDLGMRDEYNFGGNFQLLSYDDANILGFDGFFARAEIAF